MAPDNFTFRFDVHQPLRCLDAGQMVTHSPWRQPERCLPKHQLNFVTHGRYGVRVADSALDVRENEICLLPQGVPHGGTCECEAGLVYFYVHFLVDLPPTNRDDSVGRLPLHAPVARPDVLAEYFRRLVADQDTGRLDPARANLLLLLILCEAAGGAMSLPDADSAGAPLVAQAQQFIVTHFHEPIGTSVVADALGCSPDYLGRVFRRVRGCTITEAIHTTRLHYACRRLVMSTDRINEIARDYGFQDAGSFYRLFRRHKGMTPSQYRRLYAGRKVSTNM